MNIQLIRIVGVVVGGTIGGYLSGVIGTYINNKNKKPIKDNKPNIPPIILDKDISDIKINSFDDLLKKEIEIQSAQNELNNKIEKNSDNNYDNYYKEYCEILENEKNDSEQETEILFINDAIYDNDFYDYILLIAK